MIGLKTREVAKNWKAYLVAAALSVICVVTANNYSYYLSKDVSVNSETSRMAKTISALYGSCLEKKSEKSCLLEVQNLVENIKYGTTTITKTDGQNILKADFELYDDERSILESKITTPKFIVSVKKRSSPALFKSVLRSITFSASDIFHTYQNGGDITKFISAVAIPRFYPVIYSVLVVGTLILIAYFLMRVLDRHISVIEKEHENLQKNLNHIRQQTYATLKEKDSLNSRLEVLHRQLNESKDLSDLALNENSEIQKEHQELLTQLAHKDAMIKELQSKEDLLESEARVTLNKKYMKGPEGLLLKNPDIPFQAKFAEISAGNDHHGTDVILRIGKSLLKDSYAPFLVSKITSGPFGPRLQGKAILTQDNNTQKTWILKVYTKTEAGYCAQIYLHASDYAQAVLVSKYILLLSTSILSRENYDFQIDTKTAAKLAA